MWTDLFLAIALAPCIVIAVSWLAWMLFCAIDWASIKTRGIVYRRQLKRQPNPAPLNELQLANRLWKIDWLHRHDANHAYWSRDQLKNCFQETCQQLELKQISREAHELWQKAQVAKLRSKYSGLR